MEIVYLDGNNIIKDENIVSAIGFFDGLHTGHMELVNKVFEVSKEKNYKTALMTFDHHPLFVLGYNDKEEWLMSNEDRKELLESLDLDYLFIIRFTKTVAALSCDEFMQRYLYNLGIKHVVCGFDFRFGHRNSGDTDTLINSGLFDVSVISEVLYKNEKISSSRIRDELNNGHIEEVNCLLNRPYQVRGRVVQGRQIGRKIGFPTANVDYNHYHLPRSGVYGVVVEIDGMKKIGMCNIGYNPTFDSLEHTSLEVHIFDFNEDIYDKILKVYFYKFIRHEKKFNNKDELILQLSHDKNEIINYFKTQSYCV